MLASFEDYPVTSPIIIVPEGQVKQKVGKKAVRAKRNRYRRADSSSEEEVAEAPRIPVVIEVKRPAVAINNTQWFWETIAQFNWRNASEGRIDGSAIRKAFKNIQYRQVFKDQYGAQYTVLHDKLQADDFFRRNNLTTISAEAKVISHVIALGSEIYEALSNDLPFLQTLVELGECVSFDDMLPDDM